MASVETVPITWFRWLWQHVLIFQEPLFNSSSFKRLPLANVQATQTFPPGGHWVQFPLLKPHTQRTRRRQLISSLGFPRAFLVVLGCACVCFPGLAGHFLKVRVYLSTFISLALCQSKIKSKRLVRQKHGGWNHKRQETLEVGWSGRYRENEWLGVTSFSSLLTCLPHLPHLPNRPKSKFYLCNFYIELFFWDRVSQCSSSWNSQRSICL